MENYEEMIGSLKREYTNIISELQNCKLTEEVRFLTHKLISIVCALDNNEEVIFLCRQILSIDKSIDKIDLYIPCLKYILEYNKRDLF